MKVVEINKKIINKYFHKGALGWTIFAFAGALAALVIGYVYSVHIANKIDQQDRSEFLTHVQTIALLTNASDVASLAGNESDLTSPAYQRIKSMLYNLHNINSGARFVYYMRGDSDNRKLIFLADSESPGSKDYSPPGGVYNDTSPLEMKNYINATPFVEGPYTDEWGTWVSAYAPVWWQGRLVGIFGMDVTANKWEASDHRFKYGIFAISCLAVLWYVLLGAYIRRTILCTQQIRDAEKLFPPENIK